MSDHGPTCEHCTGDHSTARHNWEVAKAAVDRLQFQNLRLEAEVHRLRVALNLCRGYGRFDKETAEAEIRYVREVAREALEPR